MRFPKIFLTVGTTQFEELVAVIDSKDFQDMVAKTFGTREILVQIGKGVKEPKSHTSQVSVSFYRLKPDIKEDMATADLIITHCGAGSVTEAMNAGKPTVAVVNQLLMDNHQSELAEALVEAGPFLFAVDNPAQLVKQLPHLEFAALKRYKSPDLTNFVREMTKYIVS